MNSPHSNNGLWAALVEGTLEPLLKKAKEQEKKYEWLQATKLYKKIVDLALEQKAFLKAAELQERLGFCFYKAADQVQTNIEFRKLMKRAVQAYRKESDLLEEATVEEKQVRIDYAHAQIAYVEAMLEKNPVKKKKVLDEWWALENRVISAHENSGDLHSAGKVCNDLLEYSREQRFWLVSNHAEWEKNQKEYINLAEKTIQTFSELDDNYELARAYVLAAFYYFFSGSFGRPEDRVEWSNQKIREYSKKALELSQKTGDAWLIGESCRVAFWMDQPFSLRDSTSAMDYCEKAIKYGKIAKDNTLITGGYVQAAFLLIIQAMVLEDPDKQKESLRKAIELTQKAKRRAEITEDMVILWVAYRDCNRGVPILASIETDPQKKQELLEMATKETQEGMERLKGWKMLSGDLLISMGHILQLISKTKSEIEEKRKLLQEAKYYVKKYLVFQKEMRPLESILRAVGWFRLARVHNDLATIETNENLKIKLLKRAVRSTEKSIRLIERVRKTAGNRKLVMVFTGRYYDFLGSFLVRINLVSKQENVLSKAIDSYQKATLYFEKAEMPTHCAESYWHLAQLNDQLGEQQKASKNYEFASEAYNLAGKKLPQLADFYNHYSKYMLAWSQIEQARYSHSIEDYDKAKEHYEKTAELHKKSQPWSYLAPNYFAWATMEEAEGLSRRENTQQAKQSFQKAYEQFCNTKESFKHKLEEITSADERQMTQRLFEASDLRRKYCRARILLEEAKLLDREGNYLRSSKKYEEAAQSILIIIDKVDNEAERKELKYIAILCQAWGKMANAEETTSSESYLEAAALFEQAKDHCVTRKASLWALGNSSFCRGLAAGIIYQSNVNLNEHARAKRLMKSASTNYLQAGFKTASEYAKATQRLFDAYVFINQAEGEIDQEKRAKQYQMAENLLQISAESFMKAKQPEKTAQVQEILANVREEKALAVSLSQVMTAPSIASTTQSFTAPSPTNEVSIGLEHFEHANVQANLVTRVNEVKVGESFCLSVEFVNAGREPALLMRVEDFISPDFVVVKKPEIYRIEETCLNMKGKQLAPLKLVEVKLTLQPSKKGKYQLNPKVHYLDERGQNKSLRLKTLEIKVEEVLLEDRVSTGTQELDSLLLGGIPKEYAVVLTGPPSDEREYLIRNFLEAGIKDDEIVFYVSIESEGLEHLLEKSSFCLFLCNPKPKTQVPDLPNVYKLRSKTDLTNLSISLAKAYRSIDQSEKKRICVEIVSDVLISYKTEATRRWISELITDLGAKGFTMLAVMDPKEHPPDQATTVLNLFDGEIELTQTEDTLECKKSIRVKKLRNQDYIKNPICLT